MRYSRISRSAEEIGRKPTLKSLEASKKTVKVPISELVTMAKPAVDARAPTVPRLKALLPEDEVLDIDGKLFITDQMAYHDRMLDLAARMSRSKKDDRRFFLGAIGVRKDGTLVCAYNGAPKEPTPEHHCERRLCRKLDKGAVVYLARTLANGTWADSAPCPDCRVAMRSKGVTRVYYTSGPDTWSCLKL
jgi:hypothetical protein